MAVLAGCLAGCLSGPWLATIRDGRCRARCVNGLRDTVRLFTHPGGYSCGRSMDEKDQYDILLNLYRAADANLAAAYNALEAGYRMGREIGRG